jgi:teichuronic acid biosynthesis glycosyltransferase TuaC
MENSGCASVAYAFRPCTSLRTPIALKMRLRVLIYTTLFPNSVQPLQGHFVWERMRHLLPHIDMSVIAPIPYFPPVNLNERWYKFASIPRNERFGGFDVDHPRYVVIPNAAMAIHGISMFAGTLPQVRRRLGAMQYDLIDAHYIYPDGVAAVMLGKLFRKPVVVSARGTDINQFPQFHTIRPMVRRVLSGADGLIAVSQSLKDAMVDLGCPDEKITVIGNGVDSEKFRRQSRQAARQTLGLPDDRPIVLSVGHLIERKGFHVLIEAIGKVRLRKPNALLVIVGEGEERAHLEHQIEGLGLANNVRLVGAKPHDQLSAWYSAADIFCLASSREGWANVILEAMACGLPVVATRIWGTPEVVVSPTLGTLVQRTPEEFERAIEDALQRDWDREAIVAHARNHSWDKVAASVLKVYEKVLEKSLKGS